MQPLRILCLVFCWLALMPASASEVFRLFSTGVTIPERGMVTGYTLISGEYKFSFLPPPKWNVEGNAEKKTVFLTGQDLGTVLRFRVVTRKSDEEPKTKVEQLRAVVTERFPQGRIIHEFECFTGGRKGNAFDLETTVSTNAVVATRLAFVPFDGGTVEFELTTQPQKLEQYHFTFNCLLTSFRMEFANGRSFAPAYPERPPRAP